jgi:hypothetical protein
VDHLDKHMTSDAVVKLVCAAPVLEIRGTTVAGVPSIASAAFGRPVERLGPEDVYLATCGALNYKLGATNALIAIGTGSGDRNTLREICDPAHAGRN